ncbi:benzyl alcohol O-benzoyltransferase-like [Magnolia sinica]|uniref:benzyl alcohol O-benzoyltransferase-like n=1 Tax=Magnolia sinica TaxID=86752 RepID=UPI002659DE94|nr:benzyl alcohol O-benzoyltransferase-like [Magnolia sinica]
MAPLDFSVQINGPELVGPHTSTPREFKYLSNIDDQMGLRNHIPFIHFYPTNATGTDPVPIIRRALSMALIPYYPIAGRLRNAENGKLVVDCCEEGVIFRQANANVTLAQLHEIDGGLKPPFPQWDHFLVDDIWGSFSIVDSPLLHMQVTRLACGGFVLAYTFNHCVCDAYGALQFVTAVSEFARNPNRHASSFLPSWGREILAPRSPPRVSYRHPEYDTDTTSETPATGADFKRLAQISTFFSNADISALKRQINDRRCPTFDAVAACLWRARTRALALKTITKLLFPIDTRFRYHPSLPDGYYGTAVVFPCAVTTPEALCNGPIRYAAGLISGVKKSVVGDEYRKSVLDFIDVNGRRGFCSEGAFVVSDMSRLRFADVDLGWGPGVYGGPGRAGTGMVPGMVTSVIGHKDERGVEGVLALVSLPQGTVEMFERVIREQIRRVEEIDDTAPVMVPSAL